MTDEILQSLKWRYATKKFDEKRSIPKNEFEELLEVLRLAPSSFGLQPWKFIVVENKELREKIKAVSWNQSQVVDASHLIVLCAKNDVTEKDIDEYVALIAKERGVSLESLNEFRSYMTNFRKGVNESFIKEWAKKQVYIALGMLLESAALMKIDACPMEGFDPTGVAKVLGLENSPYNVAVLCTLGYRSSEDKYSSAKK